MLHVVVKLVDLLVVVKLWRVLLLDVVELRAAHYESSMCHQVVVEHLVESHLPVDGRDVEHETLLLPLPLFSEKAVVLLGLQNKLTFLFIFSSFFDLFTFFFSIDLDYGLHVEHY